MSAKREGWEHFRRADWVAARDSFAAALADEPEDPEALDGLGQSLWWLDEREAAIDRRREAYAAYQARGDARRAGGVAAYLAAESRIAGQEAAAAGWLSRARRLLADAEPGPELGWLEIEQAKRSADPAAAAEHARRALAIAHESSDAGIECAALAQLGRALVQRGEVEDGLAHLDEAMTVALSGESNDPLACSDACCTTLVVCEGLADLDRAAQWCEEVVEFTERRRFTPVQSWCRAIYAEVLIRGGDWERAEATLSEALRLRPDRRRSEGRLLPLAALAELRLRQGRPDEAASLLDGLDGYAPAAGPLVRLHLDRGDPAAAAALLADRRPADEGLALLLEGEVALERGAGDDAARLAERLSELARRLSRRDLAAEAAALAGRAAAARGDRVAAAAALQDALAGFAELRFPLEEARVRLALARVGAEASPAQAVALARAARDAFEALGARRDADRAAALLRELGAAGRTTVRGGWDELTGREREVLALVAAGLSNGEIAERLVIAPKTAEHHVGRVLAKLGVRSRAEAAARAAREGI